MLKIVKLINTTLSDLGYGKVLLQPHLANDYILKDDSEIEYDSSGNPFSHYVEDESENWIQDIQATMEAEYLTNVSSAETLVDALIQLPISTYNTTNSTNFGGIHNCASYINTPGYTHYQFCVDIWAFNVEVWEVARQIQMDIVSGSIIQPTTPEGFLALLPIYSGVV